MLSSRSRGASGRRTAWIALSLAAASPAATAGERWDLTSGWPDGWQRIGPKQSAAIGGLASSAILLMLFLKAPDQPRWDGPVLFDDGARNALRASSAQGRSRAGTVSDLAYLLAAYPLVVDAGLVTRLGHGKADAALQLALIDVEAIALTALLTTSMQRSVGRARPFTRTCGSNPLGDPDCSASGNTRNSSFISGHASIAFTAASAMCVQHSRLSLYASANAAVCPVALGIAATTSLLRVVADRHWASDVIAGAIVGSAVGAVVSSVHLQLDGEASGAAVSLGPDGRSMTYDMRF
ncbi:MAG: phosphatase PAP2 family protein [Myxococcales bacterium]